MDRIKYQLIEQLNIGKALDIYLILHPNGKHVGTVQVYYITPRKTEPPAGSTRVDVYGDGKLIHQYHAPHVRLKYPFAEALEGVTIGDVLIDNAPVAAFQKILKGVDILEARGFQIIKAI